MGKQSGTDAPGADHSFKMVRIMSKIAKQLTELVGNTPLLELNKYSTAKGLETPVIAKVEFFNPGVASRIVSHWR